MIILINSCTRRGFEDGVKGNARDFDSSINYDYGYDAGWIRKREIEDEEEIRKREDVRNSKIELYGVYG